MTPTMKPATAPPPHEGEPAREQITPRAGKPKSSGYAETKPSETTVVNAPDPLAPGGEASQVEAALPGKTSEDEDPDSTEDAPPGEHKRDPIKDPDPADAPLHVRGA
jgi:hypothetical protein